MTDFSEIKNKINFLTEIYDGTFGEYDLSHDQQPKRIELMTFKDTEGSFIYFQIVEGCGYDVYQIKVDEANNLIKILQESVAELTEIK